MAKHNKKRNVGIIYEQLLLSMSSAIVENDMAKVDAIKGIIKKHFRQGTELYKEFRLFNALVKTTVPSDSLATRILEESMKASRNHDPVRLEREKSLLIKDVNYILNESSFYDQKVNAYKSYATIQTLLNNWRTQSPDIGITAEYESKVFGMLREQKSVQELSKEPKADKLTLRIMQEKFNKKYGSILNEEQSELMRSYIFGDGTRAKKIMRAIKESAERSLNAYKRECGNKVLLEKIDRVEFGVKFLDENVLDDDQISRFLLLSKLKEEIMESKDAE